MATSTSKPEVVEVSPRAIRKGQVILIKGTNDPEAVRNVQVTLNMANGQSLTYDVSEMVEVVVDPDEAGYKDIIDVLPSSEEDARPVEVIRIRKLDDLIIRSEDVADAATAITDAKAQAKESRDKADAALASASAQAAADQGAAPDSESTKAAATPVKKSKP